jgi:hypothetical protein
LLRVATTGLRCVGDELAGRAGMESGCGAHERRSEGVLRAGDVLLRGATLLRADTLEPIARRRSCNCLTRRVVGPGAYSSSYPLVW